jgi:predicted helicase
MSDLASLLSSFRQAAVSEREKGTYFEELVVAYLRNEPTYKDLYIHVWTYAEWAKSQGLDAKDAGIDLVAKTAGTDEFHAIQCKFYAPDYTIKKADIDSFFTASGKKPFTHRIIVATTDLWSEHAEAALQDQHTPVTKIDLQALEESQIDWTQFKPKTAPVLKPKKELRPHQVDALKLVSAGLATADRGKLIMACGTGKTFTSLKIAEAVAGKGGRVLFLVPSLALLSQTLTEWTQESGIPLHSFAVCSDSDVGKKRQVDDDIVQTFTHELRYPATTEPAKLKSEMAKRHDADHMSVVFSTYHSIDVIHQAQDGHGMEAFDLIVCDEAHRTTGATFGDDDESTFVRVHEASYIQAAKRLYMTATPRIYGDSAKATAERNDITLCSMDNEALNDNKTYAVVWQVLQALRSHDDRFDAMVNKLELNGPDPTKMEVIAVCGKVETKQRKTAAAAQKKLPKKGAQTIGVAETGNHYQAPLPFQIGEIEKAIYAKVVQKCGNRHHWEDWAADIAKIARTHIDRITGILENSENTKEQAAFKAFAEELRDDLNDSITDGDIIEMLAQHLITKPVFDALFAGYSFASQNPISQAMQGVLDVLHEHRLDKETDTLEAFYESVRIRADGIESASGKQKIVVELYDKFFRNAFPKMTERLGIVYTPVEVVDFILHSVNHLLKTEFNTTLGSKGVHIIDPFVGTGTFITRLLQSGLIQPGELAHKYRHEIHANEIVLLAYYIAAINIEATYHDLAGGEYTPFEGICLTDTFQLYEKEDMISALLEDNSARRKRQKKLDIRVIVANPPYSIGQGSQNDNNANVEYPSLDERIESTYAARSNAALSRGLYDSYIRAIRWASDRIGGSGVVGFVTNAGFIEVNAADGLRKCLVEEFS